MAIVARSLDASTDKGLLDFQCNGALTNGETGILAMVPYPCNLNAAQLAAFNPSAGAYLMLTIQRFIPGSGVTNWVLGSTFVPPAFGTSGVVSGGVSLPPNGSTLMALMANDVLGYQVGGGVTVGIYGMVGQFVVSPVQDVTKYLGGLV